jgi:uncharacterized protein (DUF111 family)
VPCHDFDLYIIATCTVAGAMLFNNVVSFIIEDRDTTVEKLIDSDRALTLECVVTRGVVSKRIKVQISKRLAPNPSK